MFLTLHVFLIFISQGSTSAFLTEIITLLLAVLHFLKIQTVHNMKVSLTTKIPIVFKLGGTEGNVTSERLE